VKSERRNLNPWSSDDVSRNSFFREAYLDHILSRGRLCAHTQRKEQRTLKCSLFYRTKVGTFPQEASVLVVTPLKVKISPAHPPFLCSQAYYKHPRSPFLTETILGSCCSFEGMSRRMKRALPEYPRNSVVARASRNSLNNCF
jgi:hypothetical protein